MDISHDSSRILLVSSHTDVSRLPMQRTDIMEYDVKTAKFTTLLKDAEWVQHAWYAPDGRTLYVQGTGKAFDGIHVLARFE